MHRSLCKTICVILITLLLMHSFQETFAQSEQKPVETCDEQQALLLIHQQVEAVKSLEYSPTTINVLVRVGNLLWLRDETAARAVFTRAYGMAEKHFQEKGNFIERKGRVIISTTDMRSFITQIIARRDPEWARQLAERAAEKVKVESGNAVASNTQRDTSVNTVGKRSARSSTVHQRQANYSNESGQLLEKAYREDGEFIMSRGPDLEGRTVGTSEGIHSPSDNARSLSINVEREESTGTSDADLVDNAMQSMNGSTKDVVKIAKKVRDKKVRSQLLDFIYFAHARNAIHRGDFDEARQLASNVEQADRKAYLYYELAAYSLRTIEGRVHAREALDRAISIASKAPNTNEKARTLLGIAHLYSSIDSVRAFDVMGEAVKTINSIETPDFSRTSLLQRIEGASFSTYTSHTVDGFSLETVFRELAPFDFDGALLIAQGFENRPMRATAIIALAASCLENADKIKRESPDQKPKKQDKLQKPSGEKKAI